MLGPGRGDVGVRLILALVGFTPIATLALSLLELAPLHRAAPTTLSLATGLGLGLIATNPEWRLTASFGLVSGLMAVIVYDCTRVPFVIFGGWPDFIPNIGAWLLDDPGTHWSIGYLWRYLGNGAGMGLAFTMIVPETDRAIDQRLAGLGFGVAVWTGLLLTLVLSPNGQEKMFALTPATFALSLIGHLVYGGTLGLNAYSLGSRTRDFRT